MSGSKWLYIDESTVVYSIPKPKDWVFKSIAELANKEVLSVLLVYDTINRKPFNLIAINFDRYELDHTGGYDFNKHVNRKMRNFDEFAFSTPKSLSERKEPLAIPDALPVPNNKEIETLKKYLKSNYPSLYKNCHLFILGDIQAKNAIHRKNIELIKKAARIKNQKSKAKTELKPQ